MVGSRFSFLGGERELWEDSIVIRPSAKYIDKYLSMFGLQGCKPVKATWRDADWDPLRDDARLSEDDHKLFRSAVGVAQHLSI